MQDGRPEASCCPQRLDGKHSVPPRDPTRGNPLKADHNEVAAVRDRYLARTSRLAGGEAVHVGLQSPGRGSASLLGGKARSQVQLA